MKKVLFILILLLLMSFNIKKGKITVYYYNFSSATYKQVDINEAKIGGKKSVLDDTAFYNLLDSFYRTIKNQKKMKHFLDNRLLFEFYPKNCMQKKIISFDIYGNFAINNKTYYSDSVFKKIIENKLTYVKFSENIQ